MAKYKKTIEDLPKYKFGDFLQNQQKRLQKAGRAAQDIGMTVLDMSPAGAAYGMVTGNSISDTMGYEYKTRAGNRIADKYTDTATDINNALFVPAATAALGPVGGMVAGGLQDVGENLAPTPEGPGGKDKSLLAGQGGQAALQGLEMAGNFAAGGMGGMGGQGFDLASATNALSGSMSYKFGGNLKKYALGGDVEEGASMIDAAVDTSINTNSATTNIQDPNARKYMQNIRNSLIESGFVEAGQGRQAQEYFPIARDAYKNLIIDTENPSEQAIAARDAMAAQYNNPEEITAIQRELMRMNPDLAKGYKNSDGKTVRFDDGIYGSALHNAMQQYQSGYLDNLLNDKSFAGNTIIGKPAETATYEQALDVAPDTIPAGNVNPQKSTTFRNGGSFKKYAEGGSMMEQGMESMTEGIDFEEFNVGGNHEQNSNGGIQITPNALVEEGETRFQDYIFSDSIFIDTDLATEFNLPTKMIGKTFSTASSEVPKIHNKVGRKNDSYTNNAIEKDLANLRNAQEAFKITQEEEQLGQLEEQMMQGMTPEMGGMEQMAQAPEMSQDMGGIPAAPSFKFGGSMKKYAPGGPFKENYGLGYDLDNSPLTTYTPKATNSMFDLNLAMGTPEEEMLADNIRMGQGQRINNVPRPTLNLNAPATEAPDGSMKYFPKLDYLSLDGSMSSNPSLANYKKQSMPSLAETAAEAPVDPVTGKRMDAAAAARLIPAIGSGFQAIAAGTRDIEQMDLDMFNIEGDVAPNAVDLSESRRQIRQAAGTTRERMGNMGGNAALTMAALENAANQEYSSLSAIDEKEQLMKNAEINTARQLNERRKALNQRARMMVKDWNDANVGRGMSNQLDNTGNFLTQVGKVGTEKQRADAVGQSTTYDIYGNKIKSV